MIRRRKYRSETLETDTPSMVKIGDEMGLTACTRCRKILSCKEISGGIVEDYGNNIILQKAKNRRLASVNGQPNRSLDF